MRSIITAVLLLTACGDMTPCWRQARFLTLLQDTGGSDGCAVVCGPEGTVVTRGEDPEPLCGYDAQCLQLRSGETAMLWVPTTDPDYLGTGAVREQPRLTTEACVGASPSPQLD